MRYYTPIAGTHGWSGKPDGQWWYAGSPFSNHLLSCQWRMVAPLRPFIWTTDLGGVPWRRGRSHIDWQAAGENLRTYFKPIHEIDQDLYVPLGDRNVIAHSHALQVVLYACALYDLKINGLISVMSPVRKDQMEEIARLARPNIRYWHHLHSDRSDWTQIGGAMFDGAFGIFRPHPLADLNTEVKGVGHSKLLNEPQEFPRWLSWLNQVPA